MNKRAVMRALGLREGDSDDWTEAMIVEEIDRVVAAVPLRALPCAARIQSRSDKAYRQCRRPRGHGPLGRFCSIHAQHPEGGAI